MATTARAMRDVGADGARLRTMADALIERIQDAADSVSRWAWVKSYERAERHYWPAPGEHQE